MKFILNKDKLTIENSEERNSGSVKYYEADVEFDESWEGLTIEARLVEREGGAYADEGKGKAVINGKVFIDNELSGSFGIGFVGYRIENNEKIYQISTDLQCIWFNKGAGEINVIEGEVPTPSQWEIYIAQIQAIANRAGQSAEDAEESAQTATEQAGSAKSSADTATEQAEIATEKAETATIKAEEASQSASNAKTSEDNAKESENNASSSANSASESATSAENSANSASESASSASNSAGTASRKASEAESSASSANESATNAENSKKTAQELVAGFTSTVETATTNFNNNSTQKTNTFNQNAGNKTTEFNNNAGTKTDEFNQNAEEKLDEFNENAESYNNRITELEEETERLRNVIPSDTAEGNPIYITDSADLPLNKFVLEGKTEQTVINNLLTLNSVGGGAFEKSPTISNGIINVKGVNNEDYPTKTNYRNGYLNVYTTKKWKGNTRYYVSAKIDIISNQKSLDTSYFQVLLYGEGEGAFRITYNSNSNRYEGVILTPQNLNPLSDNRLYIEFRLDGMELNISEISVKDTEDYTFDGYGVQPSPDQEAEIKNVEGKNKASLKTSAEKVIGGVPFTIEEGIIKINGNTSGENFYFDSFRTKSKEAVFWIEVTGYTDKQGNNAAIILQQSSDNSTWSTAQEISLKSTSTHQFQITLDSSKYYRVRIYLSDNTFTNAEIKIQLEYGTTKTSFVSANCIQIKKCNKNLFDLKQFLTERGVTYTENADGSLTFTTTQNLYSKPFQFSEEDINVSLSGLITSSVNTRIELVNSNNEYAGNITPSLDKSQNKNACKLRFNWPSTSEVTMKNIMLNEGATAEDYIPHAKKTYNFPLSEGQKLMQDGTIENKVVNEWGEYVFTGNEIIDKYAQGTYSFSIFVRNIFIIHDTDINYAICNKLQGSTTNEIYTKRNRAGYNLISAHSDNVYGSYFLVMINNYTTIEEIKNYLAEQYANGTPVKVQYRLLEPDETAFTSEQQSVIDEIINDGTYKEVTYYTAEASINPDMEIGYYKDLETEFNNIKNAVIALGGNLDV